jgi:hypothetical protein
MCHRILILLAAFLIAAGASANAHAQGGSSSEAAPPTGQNPGTSGLAGTPAAPTSKKVWTNDDVAGLRGDSVISTVGDPNAKPGDKPAHAGKTTDARPYQAQIAKLEARIPPLDSQIAQLQSAIDGKPTGDAKSSQRPRGVKADDWSVEMQELQKKRDGILDRISALKDQARHQGVPANALP